jgi:hypothetical protein
MDTWGNVGGKIEDSDCSEVLKLEGQNKALGLRIGQRCESAGFQAIKSSRRAAFGNSNHSCQLEPRLPQMDSIRN